MKVQLLMIAEIEIDDADAASPREAAMEKLDAFREAALPAQNYGITLFCTSGDEIDLPDLLINGSAVARSSR